MSTLKLTTTGGGGGTVSLKGPAATTSNAAVELTLPVDDGTANQYLKTDGSGALSFATVSTDPTTTSGTNSFTVADGDLVIGTSGHGISFAATGDATTMSSELLDDYEEGTCAMTYSPGGGSLTIGDDDLSYTKIGQRVFISGYLTCTGHSSATGWLRINGLPFTVLSGGGGATSAHHIGVIYFRGGDSTPGSTGNYGEFPVTYKVDANQTYIDTYAVYGGLLDSGDQSICQYIGESTFIYLNFSYVTA